MQPTITAAHKAMAIKTRLEPQIAGKTRRSQIVSVTDLTLNNRDSAATSPLTNLPSGTRRPQILIGVPIRQLLSDILQSNLVVLQRPQGRFLVFTASDLLPHPLFVSPPILSSDHLPHALGVFGYSALLAVFLTDEPSTDGLRSFFDLRILVKRLMSTIDLQKEPSARLQPKVTVLARKEGVVAWGAIWTLVESPQFHDMSPTFDEFICATATGRCTAYSERLRRQSSPTLQ